MIKKPSVKTEGFFSKKYLSQIERYEVTMGVTLFVSDAPHYNAYGFKLR